MNIKRFKETVAAWDNYTENFELFRTWAENCYNRYLKIYDLEYDTFCYENGGVNKIPKEEFDLEWKNIDYDATIELYTKMNWPMDDLLNSKKLSFSQEYDAIYYDLSIDELHNKIQKIENNIEYTYAIILSINAISPKSELYSEYAVKIYTGLREYNLNECISLIENDVDKVFIAMSFDNSMNKARESIKDALKHFGYKPILIDAKEHNNQIVPEIFKEIEDSKFVIADLTGQRGGVYYEAGYATAKNKPVILCCKKDENPHFDVAQINTIFWFNENDLKQRLIDRIKATIVNYM
jgi:Nucleoside 2-deoxyribosyltransferase